jgi:hypothetical protein
MDITHQISVKSCLTSKFTKKYKHGKEDISFKSFQIINNVPKKKWKVDFSKLLILDVSFLGNKNSWFDKNKL